jgi:UDP-N-acetylmuramoyl-tripeptide--D-alanyl-D-alanine ligase
MKKQRKINRDIGKSKKIFWLEKILRWMAVIILKKYHPQVIGITGSIGKSSTKEAVFAVLNNHFKVRVNEKNYNNEIGIPLTVIGCKSGEGSIIGWIKVVGCFLKVLFFSTQYPEILILEMGADRPGDIKYLTSFIPCEIAVITDISGSHLEYFKTIKGVAQEKWSLVQSLKKDGVAIVNTDNPKILKLKNQEKKEKIKFSTFGFSVEADVRATEIFYNYSRREDEKSLIKGLGFKVNYKGSSVPVRLNKILAKHNIYAALAGITVGIELGLNLVEIAEALKNFSLPPGRMNLLAGIKNTFIIDDTYNSSPASTEAALEVLKEIKAPRKIVVLGDMLELGVDMEKGHKKIAQKFLAIKGDIFFAVGKRMKFSVAELKKHNFPKEYIEVFDNPQEASQKLKEIMQEKDLILVKGSQGMRMEKIVEEIMAKPQEAKNLLCRQSQQWKNIPWKKV